MSRERDATKCTLMYIVLGIGNIEYTVLGFENVNTGIDIVLHFQWPNNT